MKAIKNIDSAAGNQLVWDSAAPEASLGKVFTYVLDQATQAQNWYWQRKRWKALFSRWLQSAAVAMTGLAALLPIAARLVPIPEVQSVDTGLLTSLFIGAAGALVGLDRVSGLSSGWTRYMLAGTAIRNATEAFRMDWVALTAQLSSPPQPELLSSMLQRAAAFRMAIEALVLKETQDWATEFQNNLAQMERDLKLQVDQAKTERAESERDQQASVEREARARKDASQPGALEATVSNARATDGFAFDIRLETSEAVVGEETLVNTESWACIDLPAGQYKLKVSARMDDRPISGTIVVTVRPGETTKAQLTLPSVSTS
jgi:hypothetical protein